MSTNEMPEVNAKNGKSAKKGIIIVAVIAAVVIVGVILAVCLGSKNAKTPGQKNDSALDSAPEKIEIISDSDKPAEDVTAITAGVDGKGNVVDSTGIVDVSGHKIYDTGEKNNSGETIYTTGKKASNGKIIYTLNKTDSFGNQIYYTGAYDENGKLVLSNTTEKPDYTTNETPKKNSSLVKNTTTTKGYKGTSNIEITDAKFSPMSFFGGSALDSFRSVCDCKDGGYVTVCVSQSYNGDFESAGKDWNIHSAIVKYDADGKQAWKYLTGGDGIVMLYDVAELKDGSIVAVGSTSATDTDAPLNSELTSSVVIRLNKNGTHMWSYSFPGDKEQSGDFASSVAATPDGGFVVGGKAITNGGFFNGAEGKIQAYLFKFDKNCNLKWRRTLSGSMSNSFDAISVSSDGDIYAVCITTSSDGDFAGLVKNKYSMSKNSVLVKLNKDGKLLWSKNLDGSGNSEFNSVCATKDGGCVVAGSYTVAGRADGIYSLSYGKSDGYVIRYDEDGNVCWAKNFGGSNNDYFAGITEIPGGFAVVGSSDSVDFTFQGIKNSGGKDAFVLYLSETGNMSCIEKIDGAKDEDCNGVCTLSDNNIVVVGATKSSDGAFKGSGASNQFIGFSVKYTTVTKDASKK